MLTHLFQFVINDIWTTTSGVPRVGGIRFLESRRALLPWMLIRLKLMWWLLWWCDTACSQLLSPFSPLDGDSRLLVVFRHDI